MSVFGRLKSEPNGRCFHHLGTDGVVRVWHFDNWEVIDAVRLSPAQIKEWLERKPFDQAKEDTWRGVDGRGVSEEYLFNPPQEIMPMRPSQEVINAHFQRFHEKVEERKRNGFQPDPDAPACGVKRSTYNLEPL